uniref:Uncharacterized protein LOC102804302 n=1 Tax=Saccoglossus kowalevskii TaxID=10224 RepID=A0ABM0MR98_SACKO
MDLSQPTGDSVNTFINKHHYSLSYSTVDDAVALIMKHGPGSQMAKIDIKHAFRLCPVRKEDWHLLCYKWQGFYFFDRVLPFGLRSAPYLFNRIATAIEWIIQRRANTKDLLHYLDDFFAVGPPNTGKCRHIKDIMLNTCNHLGVPIAEEKIEGPATTLTFLGIELDSNAMVMRLPSEKMTDLTTTLPKWLNRQSCTKRQLLSLIGTLSFACKCIPAGRIFLRRMIDLSTTTPHLTQIINLSDEFRLDVTWWCNFLPSWNGTASFLQPTWTAAPDMHLYTDASATIGCGAFFN